MVPAIMVSNAEDDGVIIHLVDESEEDGVANDKFGREFYG